MAHLMTLLELTILLQEMTAEQLEMNQELLQKTVLILTHLSPKPSLTDELMGDSFPQS